eukprot:6172697-Pleurochrysis_carterae.AAC.1
MQAWRRKREARKLQWIREANALPCVDSSTTGLKRKQKATMGGAGHTTASMPAAGEEATRP